MTQWEQLKKEYREIPVPEDGQHQVLKAMAEAKRKRNRIKNLTRYSTVAAAVLVVVLLLPGMLLFSGGFGGSAENASMEADVKTQNTDRASGWFVTDGMTDMAPVTSSMETTAPEQGYGDVSDNSGSDDTATAEVPNYSMNDKTADSDAAVEELEQKKESEIIFSAEETEAISKEIVRQMEERMQNNGETYYIKGDEYPEGFEQISTEQEYYVNADGLLVFIFQAGVVAPKEQGTIEFIIPAGVAVP